MRKHVFVKVLLAALMVGSLAASANADEDYRIKFKVTNKTDATIHIAFAQAQTDTGGELHDDPDRSKGWFNVKPGETRTLKPYQYSPFHTIYYYAQSQGGTRVWGGSEPKEGDAPFEADRAFWIHPEKKFNVEGKEIPGMWERVGVPFRREERIAEKLQPYIVNCHLHDNYGERDDHDLPGNGNIDWKRIVPLLMTSPRLRNIQSEVLTARRNIPVRTVVECFRRLFGEVPEV